jgi:predicted O-methyltransferase YrrM
MPRVVPDAAIVSYNTGGYLANLLTSLAAYVRDGSIRRVHVWDNASSDGTDELLVRWAARCEWLSVRRSRANVHHGPALDALLREACQTDWVLVLDADTEMKAAFAPTLERLDLTDAAFVGQIHPQMPQLYAYLAHLLIHRGTYRTLPPFRHHGAPGIDYFAAVERSRRPFVRFRWCDYVTHFGQASLRQVVAGGDRDHEFYEFARREIERSGDAVARREIDRAMALRLRHAIDALPPAQETPPTLIAVDTASIARPASPARPVRWPAEAGAWLKRPLRARALRVARRLGMPLLPAEAAQLIAVVERIRPRRVVDLGTGHGGSLALWTHAAADDAVIVSADLPPWEQDDPAEPGKRAAITRTARARQAICVLRGDPATRDMRRRSGACLDDAPIDLLFISSAGNDEAVAAAAPAYIDRVRNGGLIAIANVRPHPRGWRPAMTALWRSLDGAGERLVIEAPGAPDGYGVGLLWKSAAAPQ